MISEIKNNTILIARASSHKMYCTQKHTQINIYCSCEILIYCGILILGGQCFLHYNARRFSSIVRVDIHINSWVRVTHEIYEHL